MTSPLRAQQVNAMYGFVTTDINITKYQNSGHARRIPCHHSMAHPMVADWEDALHLWRKKRSGVGGIFFLP
jgi:hypothetical protein